MELMLVQGSSLIICIGVLKGYSETMLKKLMNLQRGSTGWGPSIFVFLGVFLVIIMWAVLDTEGRRKTKLVYDNFELAPTTAKADVGLQEVEPYIPFNINPTRLQPVLTTRYLIAVPSLVANFTCAGGFWHYLRSTLNPAWPLAPGAGFGLQFMARASLLAMSLLLWVWALILPVQAATAPSPSPASNGTGVEPKVSRAECVSIVAFVAIVICGGCLFCLGAVSLYRERRRSITAVVGTPIGGTAVGIPGGPVGG